MSIDFITLLLASLATYRISLLFSKESGPAKIFAKLRRAPKKHSSTAEWLSCIFCFSITGSAFVCGLLWLAGHRLNYAEWIILWLGMSAVAIVINQMFTKGEL